MAGYATFTTVRTTRPDMTALLSAVRSATGDATAALVPLDTPGQWRGKKAAAWSAAELTAAQNALDTTAAEDPFVVRSRQKDILADAAARVRSRDITAWQAMTPAQKKTQTQNEADAWVTIRTFIENNF